MFKYNFFLFKDLPSAWLCGVRVKDLNDKKCIISVRHNWFNSNPFKSLYWAVQGMASELATGLAIIDFANKNKLKISMLVISNESKFLKKAKGLIRFECDQVNTLKKTLSSLSKNKTTDKIKLKSTGYDESGDVVSEFIYEWSFKLKE
jgi:hypothetical protein|tara:strand:- start:340 stop:783 length:444 start_codon:yes stop_codon:yes gene_type:complete